MNYGGVANQFNGYSNAQAGIGIQSGLQTAQAGLQMSQMAAAMQQLSNQGLMASMGMELNSTKNSIAMDMAAMGQRTAMTMLSKQVDQFAYNEMIREKITNLFLDMEKQRTENAFQRAKSAVQSMKY